MGSKFLFVLMIVVPPLVLVLYPETSIRHLSREVAGRIQQPGPGLPTAPQRRVDTTMPKVEGRIIQVSGEKNLQAALQEARPGDELLLKAGAEFHGSFVLPKKENTGSGGSARWIIIASDQSPSKTPAGTRVTPAVAGQFPKLVSTNAEPTLRAAAGAGYYRLVGIELTIAPSVKTSYGIVRLGEGSEGSIDQLPHDIVIDRCYVHGLPSANVRRGIALNCAASAVIDSWVSDCHEVGADSQAICGWNGPGPFEISDNYLEAAGENVMFGGADPAIPNLIPSDITFTRNYCRKPLEWRTAGPGQGGKRWSVKNLFELKNADRVLIEDNVFDNNWVDAQTGYAILFKSVNQDGKADWCVTRNVVFRGNLVRHVSSAINIQGGDPHNKSGRTALILIENNLLEDIDSKQWGGEGAFIKMTGAQDVRVDHNTALGTGSIIIVYGDPSERFVFTRNVVCNNAYGIKGDGTSTGTPTLAKFFPGYVVSGNLILGGSSSAYPPGNCFSQRPANLSNPAEIAVPGGCATQGGEPAGCELKPASVLEAARTAEADAVQ